MATEHLIEQGCRRVAHIRGPAVANGTGRLRGYRRALARRRPYAQSAAYITSGQYGDNTGYKAMQELLKLDPRPGRSLLLQRSCRRWRHQGNRSLEANLRVPEDIAIIGAGNVHYSDLLRVPLSTVDQSSTTIGETAADLLAQCMESAKPPIARHIFIPPRLVVRDSSRRKE